VPDLHHIAHLLAVVVSQELLATDSHFQAAAYLELMVWAGSGLAIVQHITSSFAFRLSLTSFRHLRFSLGCSWVDQDSIHVEEVPFAAGS